MNGRRARTTALGDGIVAIDTEYSRYGHDASHLLVEDGRAAFVDTGVNSSVPLLLDALAQNDLDVGDVDYVFLTHVHLDHAGGAGQLMQRLPNAQCVVHRYGARHMVDPARLVAGTEAVYGTERFARTYGTIEPIPEARIRIPDDGEWLSLNGRTLQSLNTEGHARHHYVLNDPQSRGIFTGDSFGVSYRDFDTGNGEFIFPTTTPVQFDPREAHVSIDRMMACEPRQLYLTHFSRVRDVERLAGDMHRRIDDHVALARRHEHDDDRGTALRAALFNYLADSLHEHGYSGDDASIHALLDNDVDLNAQGLEVWLNKQS